MTDLPSGEISSEPAGHAVPGASTNLTPLVVFRNGDPIILRDSRPESDNIDPYHQNMQHLELGAERVDSNNQSTQDKIVNVQNLTSLPVLHDPALSTDNLLSAQEYESAASWADDMMQESDFPASNAQNLTSSPVLHDPALSTDNMIQEPVFSASNLSFGSRENYKAISNPIVIPQMNDNITNAEEKHNRVKQDRKRKIGSLTIEAVEKHIGNTLGEASKSLGDMPSGEISSEPAGHAVPGESRNLTPLVIFSNGDPDSQPESDNIDPNHQNMQHLELGAERVDSNNQSTQDKIVNVLKLLSLREPNGLIQFWSPHEVGKLQLLITMDQPYGLGVVDAGLCMYRQASEHNAFVVDKYCREEELVPVIRVFQRQLPEWTYDLDNYTWKQFPQQEYAIRCNLHGYLALPVFDPNAQLCVGVLELLTASKYMNFSYEVHQIYQALKAQNLTIIPPGFDSAALYEENLLSTQGSDLTALCTGSLSTQGFDFPPSDTESLTTQGFDFPASDTESLTTQGSDFPASDTESLSTQGFDFPASDTESLSTQGFDFPASDTESLSTQGFDFPASDTESLSTQGFDFPASDTESLSTQGFDFPASYTESLSTQGFYFPASDVVRSGCRQKDFDKIYSILKTMCDVHNLPLAQTWAVSQHFSFVSHEKVIKKSCSSFDSKCIGKVCMSRADLPFHVQDEGMWPFLKACRVQHLDRSLGFVGKALLSRGTCFCGDVTKLSEEEYPLVHHARMNRLSSCFAIFLHSVEANDDYVLEFFLPPNIKDSGHVLNLLLTLKQNKEIASGFQLGDSSFIEVVGPRKNNKMISYPNVIPKMNEKHNRIKHNRKRKIDSLTMEAVEKHFGKPLYEASKSLGVSRSTLKRFCRDHDISRWPLPKHNGDDPAVRKSTVKPNYTNIPDKKMVKVTFGEYTIKFQLPTLSCLLELESEVERRTGLNFTSFRLKYKDEENDLILLACDDDLRELLSCTTMHSTIKLIAEGR